MLGAPYACLQMQENIMDPVLFCSSHWDHLLPYAQIFTSQIKVKDPVSQLPPSDIQEMAESYKT